MSEYKSFPVHQVMIDRDKSILAVEVPEHEIDVLRFVHGHEVVQDKGVVEGEEVELDPSAEAEWARLKRKYGRINAPDYVAMAFRTGPRGLSERGFSMEKRASTTDKGASVRRRSKKAAEPKKADEKK
jgi:hypothetical protein